MTIEKLEVTLWHIWEEKITREFCVNYIRSMHNGMNLTIQSTVIRVVIYPPMLEV